MKDYQEAIDVLADRELDDVEQMAVKDLENLIYQYKMRLADAELLNKLRSITGTMGDLDLKEKVQYLVNLYNNDVDKLDKEIFNDNK